MKRIGLALALILGTTGAHAADIALVYDMAVRNDPTIAAAAATRDANREAEPIARSQLLPFVSLVGDANYNYQDNWEKHDQPGPLAIGIIPGRHPFYKDGR